LPGLRCLPERVELAESVEPRRSLPDTPMARRFRGFINPQPIAQNAFEALRKPKSQIKVLIRPGV